MAESWVPPSDITDIFYKYKCIVSDISKALNIHRDTFYKHLKENSELKSQFNQVQKSLQNEWLDQAEKVVWYSLALAKNNPGHALKAATYILDRKGKDRGWIAPIQAPSDVTTINYNLNYNNDDNDSEQVLPQKLPASDIAKPE